MKSKPGGQLIDKDTNMRVVSWSLFSLAHPFPATIDFTQHTSDQSALRVPKYVLYSIQIRCSSVCLSFKEAGGC